MQTKKEVSFVSVKKGTMVYDLSKAAYFISKADFTGKLIQDKYGFLYYAVGSKSFRVNKQYAHVKPEPAYAA